MAKQLINLGTPNGRDGDTVRVAFGKINDNFSELYVGLDLLNIGSNVRPATDSIYDLGGVDRKWHALWLDVEGVHIGANLLSVNEQGAVTVNGDVVATPNGDPVQADWSAVSGPSAILNKPVLSAVATSNDYRQLSHKPTIPTLTSQLTNDAGFTTFSGSWTDLTNKPTLFNGSYLSLTNRPSLFSGSYLDLVHRPTLFSGSYLDLTNTPTIPHDVNQLTDVDSLLGAGGGGTSSIDWQDIGYTVGQVVYDTGTKKLYYANQTFPFGTGYPPSYPGNDKFTLFTAGTGGGLSVSDFGRGFTDTLDAGKITTSKLYNRPANLALNNHFVLEVTDGGVVVLPDHSIINGATLKTVPGNYAGITAGPVGHDEDSWVWVDNDGAWIATDFSDNEYTWHFDNTGALELPQGEGIFNRLGIDSGLNIRTNIDSPSLYLYSYGVDGDGTGAGNIYINPNNVEIYSSWNAGGAGERKWTFGNDGSLTFPSGAGFGAGESGQLKVNDGGTLSLDIRDNYGRGFYTNGDGFSLRGNGSNTWKFGTTGILTFPNNSTFDGQTLTDHATSVNYTLKIVNGDVAGSKFAIGTGSAAFGIANDALNQAEDGYVPYSVTAQRINLTVLGAGSWVFDNTGNLTVPGDIKSAAGVGPVVIEANDGTLRTWTFGGDGSLTFPDAHLTVSDSTIERKTVTVITDGMTTTTDVVGSRLTFTDTTTSLETYNDPDGPNNTAMARHYTGTLVAGLEVYQEDIAGQTGTTLEVNGSGVVIESGDGILSNTWNFDIGGDLFVPNRIRHQDQTSELNLNANNNGSIYMSPDPTADVNYLLLNASGQIELSTNHNVLVAAASGPTELSTIYAESEYVWEMARDADAVQIAPATRPWAGMPSFEAYPLIMSYTPPGGVPILNLNMTVVAKVASDNYTAWQEELAASCVAVTVGSKQWSFVGDGKFTLPNGGAITSDGDNFLTSTIGSTAKAGVQDLAQNTQAYAWVGGFKVETNRGVSTKTWSFGTDGNLTLPVGSDIKDSNGASVLGRNPFDQSLNTTNSVTFKTLTVTPTMPGNVALFNGPTGSDKLAIYNSGAPGNGTSIQSISQISGHYAPLILDGVAPIVRARDNIGSYKDWTFGTDGNLSAPANGSVTASKFTSYTSSWDLDPGANTVDFSVPGPGTYTLWVNGNVPNGIVTYTATVVVTNQNVPVLGTSYGWYYTAGNALVLTAIPTQIIGTANGISTAVVSTTTAWKFTFGITNNSGDPATVNYGYTRLG